MKEYFLVDEIVDRKFPVLLLLRVSDNGVSADSTSGSQHNISFCWHALVV